MDINNTKIIKHPALGNGLAPTIDVQAGELLVSISSPLLILVEQEALDKVCSCCLAEKPPADLKRCSGCKILRYCSTACQKADWTSIHQKECSILKKLPGVPPTPVRGMIQMLLRHQHGPRMDPKWAGLESHVEELKKSKRWDEIVLQSRAAVEFAKCSKEWLEMAVNLLCRMSTNAFRATLPDDTPIGLCFSPTLAMANHSCSPNAAIIFNGRTVSLRSLYQIKAGEQIFISYIDPVQARKMRRIELRQRYFFTCECEVCKQDENTYQTFLRIALTSKGGKYANSEVWWDVKKLITQAEKYSANANSVNLSILPVSKVQTLLDESRAREDATSRLTFLDKALSCMQPLTSQKLYAIPPYPMVLNELYLHHLDTGAYLNALIILLFLSTHCDPFTYPQPIHPIRVLRLYTISKLLKHVASLPNDSLLPPESTPFNEDQRHRIRNIDYISAVHVFLILTKELGEKSHGKDSRFLKEVEEELVDVESVQRERNGGGVGLELRRWMVQGGLAVEGKLLAETAVGGLRELEGFVERVVAGIKVEESG